MTLAMYVLAFHVAVAVLGIGLIGALPLGARNARHAGLDLQVLSVWAPPLLLAVRLSLLLAFASGALLDFLAHGAWHEALWFRLAGLLVVVTAICLARARVALTRGLAGGLTASLALRRIERWGFTSMIAVACVVLLMECKPF
jgi:hypothetical protein